MLVKCKCHGEKHERNDLFKVVVNNKNEYYCSENDYITIKKEKDYKADIYSTINEIFGYKVINTLLFKEISNIATTTSYEKLHNYINYNKEMLNKIMSGKTFNNEVGKIRYFSTIIKNNIIDYVKQDDEQLSLEPKEYDIEKVLYKPKNRRKCINDYLEEM